MCKEMDRIYQEGLMDGERRGERRGEKRGEKRGERRGREIGIALGKKKMAQEMAISLSKRGMSVSEIAEVANVNVEVVKKWLSESAEVA